MTVRAPGQAQGIRCRVVWFPGPVRHVHVLVRGACVALLAGGLLLGAASAASASLPPIRHVFVIIDENESESTTFGPGSEAPYLSQTLVSQGAYLSHYYGIGHASLDNYIAMVSGQAPNPQTSGDCPTFANFGSPSLDPTGQETDQGCVYPANVPTLMSQLDAAGLTWRAYEDSMGADPTRESATCGHPTVGQADNTEAETPLDQYATRHDPFVYFHSVIDNSAQCNADVVNLSQLPTDLQSVARTPNYVFVTPALCDDGHDATCANGGPGGLGQADTFLKTWVPRITSSPAFQQNGLLIITFDEAVGDSSACCGEAPGPYDLAHGIQPGGNGPGGGLVGAVLLSRYIAPGTTSSVSYNHYSMLGTVEDLFALPRLADAAGATAFGSDVFTKVPPQDSRPKLSPAHWSHKHPRTTITYTDSEAGVTTLAFEALLPGYRSGHATCKALAPGHKRPKHTSACQATKPIGSFTHTDTAGKNTVTFRDRVGSHTLAPGTYVIEVTPALESLRGTTQSARFQVR